MERRHPCLRFTGIRAGHSFLRAGCSRTADRMSALLCLRPTSNTVF